MNADRHGHRLRRTASHRIRWSADASLARRYPVHGSPRSTPCSAIRALADRTQGSTRRSCASAGSPDLLERVPVNEPNQLGTPSTVHTTTCSAISSDIVTASPCPGELHSDLAGRQGKPGQIPPHIPRASTFCTPGLRTPITEHPRRDRNRRGGSR